MSAIRDYFRDIKNSLLSTVEGMAVTHSWLFRKPITIQYPYKKSDPRTRLGGPDTLPDRYRGFLEVDIDICSACLACMRACPIDCIAIDVEKIPNPDPEGKPLRAMMRFDIDLAKCMYCGLCSEPCPTGSIRHTKHFEGTVTNIEHLTVRFIEPGTHKLPFKVKKGETPDTVAHGSVVQKLLVDRQWDLPAIDFPPPPPPPAE